MQECKKRNVAAVAAGEKLCRVNPITVKTILRILCRCYRLAVSGNGLGTNVLLRHYKRATPPDNL
jgi:hypothetical protein